MANYQELANLVWNAADDVLRGLFKPHEYDDITLPFLVLRRFDCISDEDGWKEKAIETYNRFKDQVSEDGLPPIIQRATNASFYNISQYNLSRLKADPNNIYLNGFSQDVRDIIENFNLWLQIHPLAWVGSLMQRQWKRKGIWHLSNFNEKPSLNFAKLWSK